MSTSFAFLLFGVIVVAAIFSAAKIQRAELAEARAKRDEANEIERKRQARLAEFRAAGIISMAKIQRVDGD